MNIKEATDQIEGAVRAYLSHDEHGIYRIPSRMQRPIIMMGPPGVGKTAIAAQIADELGINFVSYSITHHTRQSALGLPYIATAEFGGREYRVSRYTMSEIIAAVWDAIEATGVSEGILFLDEVNCASETLMPSMLQFLQYKTFGQHRLPEGWAIVCAGNPPEYNRAAREFDPAMMDRLKRIDVEPDLDVWQDYAAAHGVHPAITTYLANKPQNFFRVRASGSGARIVTARGWEDLSRMILAYEREGLPVDGALVAQYLQDREVAEDFTLYFELFAKYQDDYKVADILAGKTDEAVLARAQAAAFDERVAVVNLLLAAVTSEVHAADAAEKALRATRDDLVAWKGELEGATVSAANAGNGASTSDGSASASDVPADPLASIDARLASVRKKDADARARGVASEDRQLAGVMHADFLGRCRMVVARVAQEHAGADPYEAARSVFNDLVRETASSQTEAATRLDRALGFLDTAFGDGQEMLVFTSRVATDPVATHFIAAHGPKSFAAHARALMFDERGLDLLKRLEALG